MDRAQTASPAPISLESHPLPPVAEGERVRRRGHGYLRIDAPAPGAPEPANRAARRRALRLARRRRRPLSALLIGPAAVLLAGPAAADVVDGTTTTVAPTTTVEPAGPTTAAPTTVAAGPTTGAPTVPSPTAPDPTVPAPTSATTTTTTAAPAPATSAPTTAPAPSHGAGTVRATVVSTTVPDTTTTSTTAPLPGATEAPPVGQVELPPETPLDADPVAAAASAALAGHLAVTAGTRALTELADRHAALDAEVARLEARVAELTGLAFELARTDRPTAETELLRADATVAAEAARTERATVALRQALVAADLQDASDRYPAARLALATLVTARTGGNAAHLNAVWATTSDARLAVVYAALAQVGDPYVWATAGPDTFDCSGLTGFAWRAAGVRLEHYTVTQRETTLDVAEADLRAGDLVFNLDGPNGGHVGLYLGLDRLVVHAPAPGRPVSVSSYGATTGFGSPLADPPSLVEPVAAVAER